jgi:hypothetical protein
MPLEPIAVVGATMAGADCEAAGIIRETSAKQINFADVQVSFYHDPPNDTLTGAIGYVDGTAAKVLSPGERVFELVNLPAGNRRIEVAPYTDGEPVRDLRGYLDGDSAFLYWGINNADTRGLRIYYGKALLPSTTVIDTANGGTVELIGRTIHQDFAAAPAVGPANDGKIAMYGNYTGPAGGFTYLEIEIVTLATAQFKEGAGSVEGTFPFFKNAVVPIKYGAVVQFLDEQNTYTIGNKYRVYIGVPKSVDIAINATFGETFYFALVALDHAGNPEAPATSGSYPYEVAITMRPAPLMVENVVFSSAGAGYLRVDWTQVNGEGGIVNLYTNLDKITGALLPYVLRREPSFTGYENDGAILFPEPTTDGVLRMQIGVADVVNPNRENLGLTLYTRNVPATPEDSGFFFGTPYGLIVTPVAGGEVTASVFYPIVFGTSDSLTHLRLYYSEVAEGFPDYIEVARAAGVLVGESLRFDFPAQELTAPGVLGYFQAAAAGIGGVEGAERSEVVTATADATGPTAATILFGRPN